MTNEDRCPRCAAPYVEIDITAGGHVLTMRSCSECDQRSWRREGEPLDLDAVLSELGNAQ